MPNKIVNPGDVANMYDKDLREKLDSSSNPKNSIDVFNNSTYMIEAFSRSNEMPGYRETIESQRRANELTQEELKRVRAEQDVEKRRINEKQIRALRNNYRGHGSSTTSVDDTTGMSNKLGG